MAVEAFAPAKINLTLHVTGRRADGYHLLDSLVVFVDVGDRLRMCHAAATALRVTGPMAGGVPLDGGNLVLRAAALFKPKVAAEIVLDKHLPAAAGIGGGSSDAAAALRALAALAAVPLPPAGALVTLGADVPVCLHHRPRRMRGIGDVLDDVAPLPPLHVVLVNPGVPTPTGAVFAGLRSRDNAPMADVLPGFAGAGEFCDWLATQRNDLQAPAMALVPEIGTCLDALAATDGCLLARMSGSGATCVGCYASHDAADAAALAIGAHHPDWWVAAGSVLAADAPLRRP